MGELGGAIGARRKVLHDEFVTKSHWKVTWKIHERSRMPPKMIPGNYTIRLRDIIIILRHEFIDCGVVADNYPRLKIY